MANTKNGVVISVSKLETITSKQSGRQFSKRSVYVDCTPHDPYTLERSEHENKIVFEFIDNNTSMLDGVNPNDVVRITFDLQGVTYKTQDGQTKFSTNVRPYKLEILRKADGTQSTQTQQVASTPQPQAVAQPTPPPAQQAAPQTPPPAPVIGQQENESNLPF